MEQKIGMERGYWERRGEVDGRLERGEEEEIGRRGKGREGRGRV